MWRSEYETTTTRVSSWPGAAFLLKLWLEAITSIVAYGKLPSSINEVLHCARDTSNTRDPYAVRVIKSGTGVVDHLPKKISTACSLFIRRGGSITCIVTGSRRYSRDLPQGGMEIPCLLEFTGSVDDTKRVEKLTRTAMGLPDIQSSLPPAQSPKEQNSIENAKRKTVEVLDSSESLTEVVNSDPPGTCTGSKKFKSSLTADEMDEIIMGRKLTDRHISFAQDLKSQFGNINGLECTLWQSKESVPVSEDATKNKLQVFHDRHDHWIAASNMLTVEAGQVAVYDSVYRTLDALTKDAIIRKFQCAGTCDPPVIKLMNFQKQKGSIDCGVFAIAVITALAFGQEPSTLKFIQEKMRPHLSTCFQNEKMTPFPTSEKHV